MVIKKIFSLNLSQSLVMDGDRIIAIEDIFGTDNMIKKFKNLIDAIEMQKTFATLTA